MTIIEKLQKKRMERLQQGTFNVAGVTFENRQEILQNILLIYKIGNSFPVIIEHEKNNQYDENALGIKVLYDYEYWHIGYVPKTINKELKELLDNLSFKLISLGCSYKGIIGATIQYKYNL